jgi:hypothetical protein
MGTGGTIITAIPCHDCGNYMDRPAVIYEVAGTNNVVLECDHCGVENTVTDEEAMGAGYL